MHSLLLSLLLGASGDILWIEPPVADVELTPADKALVGTAVVALGVPADKVDYEKCHQNTKEQHQTPAVAVAWTCELGGEVALTDAQYAEAYIAGAIKDPKAATIIRKATVMLTAAQLVDHDALVQAVFAQPLSAIYAFNIWRDEEVPTKIMMKAWPIKQGTPTQFRAAATADPSEVQAAVVVTP